PTQGINVGIGGCHFVPWIRKLCGAADALSAWFPAATVVVHWGGGHRSWSLSVQHEWRHLVGRRMLIVRSSCHLGLFHRISLLLPATGKPNSTVERCSAPFAARTRLDAKGVSHTLDEVAKPSVFVTDEPWEPHSMGSTFGSVMGFLPP